MIAALLPALKGALIAALADTSLTKHERGQGRAQARPAAEQGIPTFGPPAVFIGDLPPRSARESVFPCVIITPLSGHAEGGELFEEVAFLAGVYSPEDGDAEGAEMELALLRSRIMHFLREALDVPVQARFTCIRDEKHRYARWQRADPLGQPRPFAQVAVIARWSIPGWE